MEPRVVEGLPNTLEDRAKPWWDETGQTDPETSSVVTQSTWERRIACIKPEVKSFFVLLILIVALVLGSRYFGTYAEQGIAALEKVPLGLSVTLIIIAEILRKIIPPFYFVFPLGSVLYIFLSIRLPLWEAVLVKQLISLHNIVVFPIFRYVYSGFVEHLCEPAPRSPTRTDRALLAVLPRSVKLVLQALDREWRITVIDASVGKQILVMVAWSLAESMNDLVTALWWPTRSGVSWLSWTVSMLLVVVIQVPKVSLRMRIFAGLAGAASGTGLDALILAIADLAWYEIVGAVVITLISSIYVHGKHAILLWRALRACCGRERGIRGSSTGADGAAVPAPTMIPPEGKDQDNGSQSLPQTPMELVNISASCSCKTHELQ